MNDLMRTSMITFSQKIYGWGQSSFDFNSNHYFDFIENERKTHYLWVMGSSQSILV